MAFYSRADNLVPGDSNGLSDVFVRDMNTGSTILVSKASGGPANGASDHPNISNDGTFVAFESSATNLVANDFNGQDDVFLSNLSSGEISLVSVSSAGVQGNNASLLRSLGAHAISDDNRYIVFQSDASNLIASDSNNTTDIFRRDRTTRGTTRVSVDSGGNEANGFSYNPSLSSDGRSVLFRSIASTLVSNDTNSVSDVFVHEGFQPTETQPPDIRDVKIERRSTNKPFYVTLQVTVDDTNTGNSPIARLRWSWDLSNFDEYRLPSSASSLETITIDISVLGSRPDDLNHLFIEAFDNAGNSRVVAMPWQAPRAPLYIAIGDSYASGHHGGPFVPDLATAQPNDPNYGYPSYLNQELDGLGSSDWRYTYGNIAVSGSNTAAILGQAQRAASAIQARPGSWNVVSVTGGANDTTWETNLVVWFQGGGVVQGISSCPQAPAVPGAYITRNIAAVLGTLRGADVNALLFATGYPNPYPGTHVCYASARAAISLINQAVRNGVVAAPDTGVYWVDYSSEFAAAGRSAVGHHPWMQYTDFGWPHPNTERGHPGIANTIFACFAADNHDCS